jgi:demethylmenaquinone methyltransferase/2-methoxy-6-polyprenyl-1,4-benzoquinol methylase
LASTELLEYYRRRAAEYEAIYAKPERQQDLACLSRAIPARLHEREVLEIACGTGYWTERVAPVAARVVATDLAEEPMRIARSKPVMRNVEFVIADAYALPETLGRFDAALAVFWWSHVPRERGADIDAQGNTYQLRRLGDGSAVRVLKNFPSEAELRSHLPGLRYEALEYYWLAEYRLP